MAIKHAALLSWLKTASDDAVQLTGTTRNYLRLIGYGVKSASPAMALSPPHPLWRWVSKLLQIARSLVYSFALRIGFGCGPS